MTTPEFRGIIPPLVTPRTEQGQVDVDSLTRLTRHLLDAGVHGLFVLGSTGEVAYLTDAERELVVRTVVAENAGQVPVLAGAIDLTAQRVAAQARAVVGAGADAVVVTAPLYTLNDTTEIAAHFRHIAGAVRAPVFAYDIPVRAGVKLEARMLVHLGSDGVIAGVKDSSGDDVGFRRLVAANAAAGSPLALFTGHETVVDGMLLLGADGVVPGLANVDAAGYVRLWDRARAGQWAQVRAEQDRLAQLFEIVFQAKGRSPDISGVGAFKVAMAAQGLIDASTPAWGLDELEPEVARRITAIVRDAGLAQTLADA